MKIIPRNDYLNKIKPSIGQNIIKVLTGQRRTGKSYLMKQIREMIKTTEPTNTNIIFIDKEKLEFDDLKDYKDLYRHIIQKTDKTCKNVVMIDEVQAQPVRFFTVNARFFSRSMESALALTVF